MPSVTVSGAHGQTVTLTFDSQANAALASKLAEAITNGVKNGAIIPAVDTDGPPPPVPPGKSGEFVITKSGNTTLPPGYGVVVDTAPNARVFTGTNNVAVLGSTGNLDVEAKGGSGIVVSGAGNDRINAAGDGNWTIAPGGGNNQVILGNGSDSILSLGSDHIIGGTGRETVDASQGHADDLIQGNASQLVFVGGAGSATIFGGTGSDTIFGDHGPDHLQGGTAGSNLIVGGDGEATIIGGGEGDQLFAGGEVGQLLKAGPGNETLVGGFGNDTMVAGGSTQMLGGFGNDTFIAGGGNATITAGSGALFEFVKDGGGDVLVNGFLSGNDQIGLSDFGKGEINKVVASQTHEDGGTTITFSDNLTVTFTGVTALSESDFITIQPATS
jgi:Ca2+-binding RTX toxin-like protein